MYDYFEGRVIKKDPSYLVLDVNGIGYKFFVSTNTFSQVPFLGEKFKVYVYLAVREDALQLYGFGDEEERELFTLLISVSGVGPKLGITVLSGIHFQDLKQAIYQKDVSKLTKISGIGKKTAERLVVELKEKISCETIDTQVLGSQKHSFSQQVLDDSVAALIALGYKRAQASKTVETLLGQNTKWNVEDIIRESLSIMSRG